jgi:hypothetical protein
MSRMPPPTDRIGGHALPDFVVFFVGCCIGVAICATIIHYLPLPRGYEAGMVFAGGIFVAFPMMLMFGYAVYHLGAIAVLLWRALCRAIVKAGASDRVLFRVK